MTKRVLFTLVVSAVFIACSSTPPALAEVDSGTPTGGTWTEATDAGSGDDAGATVEDAGATSDDAGMAADAGLTWTGIRFLAIGDTGKGNTGQTQVGAAMAQWCKTHGCNFAVMLGDNIYPSGVDSVDDPQWQTKFEVPYQDLDIPFYAVLGNHDYGGNGAGTEFDKGQHEVDYTAVSTKWKMPAKVYTRIDGNAEFIATDTNMQMFASVSSSNDAQQRIDVAKWLADSTADWKIVIGHHPYLSNGPHGNAGDYDGLSFVPVTNGKGVKKFADEVWCGKADVYLAGHDHSRQWLVDTCLGTELIVSGSAAATTNLEGSNPVHFQSTDLGWVYITIDGKDFTADFVDVNGVVQFSRTISK